MNKYTYIALALAPVAGMTVQASPEVTAQDTIKAALTQLATQLSGSQEKDLPTIVAELDSLLTSCTPGILQALEPLTAEQRSTVLSSIMQSEEINALTASAAPLAEGKAAATVMPAVAGEGDPMTLVTSLTPQTKMQMVDITANLLKIGIALGLDSPAILESFMGGSEEEEEAPACAE